MRRTAMLMPLLKEIPAEATIPSHQLMLRAGMVRQHSVGIYSWLPLGLRALRRVSAIIRTELDAVGASELLMPTMQPAGLWQESGRGSYGKETLRAYDRYERELIYGPTHEEVITDLFRRHVRSYKQLPLLLYQIQWKFRDEIRPRFGVMRGREFLMKDAYSFASDATAHQALYDRMFAAYFRIFRRMGLQVIPFVAETGKIGGDMSHEFQVVARTGESEIFYDPALEALTNADPTDIDAIRAHYAAADTMHDPVRCPVPEAELVRARGIEVGHIFYFADKYSAPMKAMITNATGQETPVMMGAHGIGVSRLLGAIIEVHHDAKGICWPPAVAPFDVGLVQVRMEDAASCQLAQTLEAALTRAGLTVLYDDSRERAGAKFAAMELIGLPYYITIGPALAKDGQVEMTRRLDAETHQLTPEDAIARISAALRG